MTLRPVANQAAAEGTRWSYGAASAALVLRPALPGVDTIKLTVGAPLVTGGGAGSFHSAPRVGPLWVKLERQWSFA